MIPHQLATKRNCFCDEIACLIKSAELCCVEQGNEEKYCINENAEGI